MPGDRRDVEELRAASAQVRAALRDTQKELEKQSRLLRKANARERKSGLSLFEARVVLRLYVAAGYESPCAATWLHRRRAGAGARQCKALTLDECCRTVEDEFLEASGESIDLATSPRPKHAAGKQADKFYDEWRLATWVANTNVHRGVAPSSAALCARAAKAHRCAIRGEPVAPRNHMLTGRERMWALRWRRAFKARLGRLQVRDKLGIETLRAKAPAADSGPRLARFFFAF